jgi:hypothetical protein
VISADVEGRRVALVVSAVVAVALSGCGTSVRHPLDDSETRPASAEAAKTEANLTLDELEETTLDSAPSTSEEWVPDSGCDTLPDAPEQGTIGSVLIRSYAELPDGTTIDTLLNDQEARWEADGHTVDRNSPNMAPQVINRSNGIGYTLVSTPPGAELRAFLPCY